MTPLGDRLRDERLPGNVPARCDIIRSSSGLMQIDAHQHFWLYHSLEYAWIDDSMAALRRNFLPHDLAGELKSAGFDGSIAVQARQSLEETRWLLELAGKSASIVGVVGWIDLRSPDVRSQLKPLVHNPKLVGVRHIVQSEPDDGFLLRPDFLRGISVLEEFDLAYDLLIYTKHLPVAIEFVQKFPRQRFVVDHLAKPPIKSEKLGSWAQGIGELAKFPNVYCKVSGLVTEADWQRWTPDQIRPCLEVAFDSFGPERLMVGSDWPVCLVAASYPTVLQLAKDYIAARSPQSLSAVLGGNAARFYGLRF
jgi:L-fuconolactonase